MAKKIKKYGDKVHKILQKTMHEYKMGKLTSGKSNRRVKSRKQAIAIGLSEARKEGLNPPNSARK